MTDDPTSLDAARENRVVERAEDYLSPDELAFLAQEAVEEDARKYRVWWEQAMRLRSEVERILDRVLGDEEEDGAGAGLVGDVLLAIQKAWDEGYSAGDADQYVGVMPSKRTANPYRNGGAS